MINLFFFFTLIYYETFSAMSQLKGLNINILQLMNVP